MSTAVSTEGRVFVARLMREVRARERFGADLLTPGATNWTDAYKALARSIAKAKGPKKAAGVLRAAYERLKKPRDHGAFMINAFDMRSRSGAFELMTYQVARHPLTQAGYEGVAVNARVCYLQRNGTVTAGYMTTAFLSWHALARIAERSNLDIAQAYSIAGWCGIAGMLLRESDKHENTALNLMFDSQSLLVTGVLRGAIRDGKRYRFFDVLTALTPNETQAHAHLVVQGRAVASAAQRYVAADTSEIDGYADAIKVLPFVKDDYVSRALKTIHGVR